MGSVPTRDDVKGQYAEHERTPWIGGIAQAVIIVPIIELSRS